MTHSKVYREFKLRFPLISEHVVEWFPNGKQSVRVRLIENDPTSDYVFSFVGNHDWCFETVDSYIKKIKKENDKMTC